MNQHTPAQVKAIETWTAQRDSLHREIGIASTELETTTKALTEGGLALDDLRTQIANSRGRLAELEALEERVNNSTTLEITALTARKSRLESECEKKEADLSAATEKYDLVVSATKTLSAAHDTMKDQSTLVSGVVTDVIETTQAHLSKVKDAMGEIADLSDKVIAKSKENVDSANIVFGKLPEYIFKMQKPIPIRRQYPEGHPRLAMSGPEEAKETA